MQLYNALRHPANKYRYALLSEKKLYNLIKGRGNQEGKSRCFELPEGFLHLASRPLKGEIPLWEKPVRLIPFIITWDHERQRARLQINRDFVRNKLKIIRSQHKPYYFDKGKFKKVDASTYILFVNEITRELETVARYCFVYPQTIRAYNLKLRKMVYKFLTDIAGMKKEEAQKTIKRYIHFWQIPKKKLDRPENTPSHPFSELLKGL